MPKIGKFTNPENNERNKIQSCGTQNWLNRFSKFVHTSKETKIKLTVIRFFIFSTFIVQKWKTTSGEQPIQMDFIFIEILYAWMRNFVHRHICFSETLAQVQFELNRFNFYWSKQVKLAEGARGFF